MTDIRDSFPSMPSILRAAYQRVKTSAPLAAFAAKLTSGRSRLSREGGSGGIQQRSNRAAASDLTWLDGFSGSGTGWARTEYGEYYATSVSVYAAVKLRAEALSRPPLQVYRRDAQGIRLPVEQTHPMQRLFDRVNHWFTRRYSGKPGIG